VTEPDGIDPLLPGLLSRVGARTSAPGAGVVIGLAAGLAAALAAMGARFADGDGALLVDRADELSAAAIALAQADPAAYGGYVEARRSAATRAQVAAALDRAVEVPLELAGVAAEVAGLGLRLVLDGNPRLRGDSATAVLLAVACARAAAVLVVENLVGSADDGRVAAAAAAAARAGAAERTLLARYPALGPTPSG
jgi:formiminotetrahydrofolate cyclodeaminase